MIDGHPFETEELDLRRAEQRRILRSVPDWLLDPGRYRMPERDLSHRPDASFEETLVRVRAQAYAEHLGDLISEWSDCSATEACGRLFDSLDQTDYSTPLAIAQSDLRNEVLSGPRESGQIPEGSAPKISRMLHLLLLADQLASDSYADSRLTNERG